MSAPDRYLSGAYAERHEDWHLGDAPWKTDHIDRLLRRNPFRFSSALDVGCGAGGVTIGLAQRYPDVSFTGYEIAAAAEALRPSPVPPNVRFVTGDVLATDERADLVLLVDVFEHVPDYLGFLRALHPRGERFVFNIPLDLNLVNTITDRYDEVRAVYGHLHFFSRSTALAALDEAGYAVVDTLIMGQPPRSPATQSALQRALHPARRLAGRVSPELAARVLGGSSLVVLAS